MRANYLPYGLCLSVMAGLAVIATARLSGRLKFSDHQPKNDDQVAECIDFLKSHMPEQDIASISDEFLISTATFALQARTDNAWAQHVSWNTFLDFVLPYSNLDEPREDWRSVFYPLFKPMVAGTSSLAEAALLLNKEIWSIWGIHFKSDQAPEILSPSQVIKAGYGSCSALSIFLVNACRAVGIPARVAGTPCWVSDRRDAGEGSAAERFNNHNWVEVWDGRAWSFMGAAEWVPEGYNRTWFFPQPAKRQVPGSLMNAIYAATYRPLQDSAGQAAASSSAAAGSEALGRYFPLAWSPDDSSVPAIDVTQSYLDTPDVAQQGGAVQQSAQQ